MEKPPGRPGAVLAEQSCDPVAGTDEGVDSQQSHDDKQQRHPPDLFRFGRPMGGEPVLDPYAIEFSEQRKVILRVN